MTRNFLLLALLVAGACTDGDRRRIDAGPVALDGALDAPFDANIGECTTDDDCVGDCLTETCKCMFELGACGGPGRCASAPMDCGTEPWCGCDGVTYDGYCFMYSAGVSPRSRGECP